VRRAILACAALAAALAWAASGSPAAQAQASTVAMSGSSTALPVVADLAYFYRRSHRRVRFDLTGGGSSAGLIDVARGITDAGLISRERAADDPPGLVFTPFARSAVCLVTNRSNRLPGLTRATIQDLVAGRAGSWAQVPGATRTDAVVPVGLVEGRGARTVFTATFIDPATPVAHRPRAFGTASQVRAFVLSTPGAWGYVDLRFTAGLHVVPYEGVPCTEATVRSGAYPATRPLSIVTRGAPRGHVARFLRWMSASATARRVIASRYVPLRVRVSSTR